jgi:hypothetical protein
MKKQKKSPPAMLGPAEAGGLRHPIMAIEYQKRKTGWKPSAVLTAQELYEFDWCGHSAQLVWQSVGGGFLEGGCLEIRDYQCAKPARKIWLAPGVQISLDKKTVTREEARLLGNQIIKHPLAGNPFDSPAATGGETEYCEECGSMTNVSEDGEMACKHIQFEEGGSGYSLGCGSKDVDFQKAQRSLGRLLRLLPAAALDRLEKSLGSGKFNTFLSDSMLGGNASMDIRPNGPNLSLECLAAEFNYEERYWPGIAWLRSLDPKTKSANALTAGWVWQWRRGINRSACVIPESALVQRLTGQEMNRWMELDPEDPGALAKETLRVEIPGKAVSVYDLVLQTDPAKIEEIILDEENGNNRITLSVARVWREGPAHLAFKFGRVLERNGKHLSHMGDYRLCS